MSPQKEEQVELKQELSSGSRGRVYSSMCPYRTCSHQEFNSLSSFPPSHPYNYVSNGNSMGLFLWLHQRRVTNSTDEETGCFNPSSRRDVEADAPTSVFARGRYMLC